MPDTKIQPLVSVIIDNYNYARYLSQAIDSALAQTYPHVEVIVVDDGSTDNSREIISAYGDKVIAVLKANGGQASALNAGFLHSQGEIIVFLDSDDALLPEALQRIVPCFDHDKVAKVHWPLWITDADGQKTGEMRPPSLPPEHDYRELILERGPSNYPSPPTSGNAWLSWLLAKIMPVPEELFRLCADDYLFTCAPIFGLIRAIAEPQGFYRIHGKNAYSAKSYAERLQIEILGYDRQCLALKSILERNGFTIDVSLWKRHSWFHHLSRGIEAIQKHIPDGETFVLIDGGTWGAAEMFGDAVQPFMTCNGEDWGTPADDERAVRRFEEWRTRDLNYLVIAWSCYWWMESYPGLLERFETSAVESWRSDDVFIYRFGP